MARKLSSVETSATSTEDDGCTVGLVTFDNDYKYKIDIEGAKSKVYPFIATPCYGGMVADRYTCSLLSTQRLLMKAGLDFEYSTLRNESLITRARNILVSQFMTTNCTHLFFIDADIEWLNPEDALRLPCYGLPITIGAYPKKTIPPQLALNFKYADRERTKLTKRGPLVEVLDGSTGFFCVERSVIEKMMKEYPNTRYRSDSNIGKNLESHCYALFDCVIDEKDNRYLSEDYAFCRKHQDMGGKIWVDTLVDLNHCGAHIFESNIKEVRDKIC